MDLTIEIDASKFELTLVLLKYEVAGGLLFRLFLENNIYDLTAENETAELDEAEAVEEIFKALKKVVAKLPCKYHLSYYEIDNILPADNWKTLSNQIEDYNTAVTALNKLVGYSKHQLIVADSEQLSKRGL